MGVLWAPILYEYAGLSICQCNNHFYVISKAGWIYSEHFLIWALYIKFSELWFIPCTKRCSLFYTSLIHSDIFRARLCARLKFMIDMFGAKLSSSSSDALSKLLKATIEFTFILFITLNTRVLCYYPFFCTGWRCSGRHASHIKILSHIKIFSRCSNAMYPGHFMLTKPGNQLSPYELEEIDWVEITKLPTYRMTLQWTSVCCYVSYITNSVHW